MSLTFGAGFVDPDNTQRSNPNGLTPDGTVVGRVRRRDERNNSSVMDALIKLFGEMLGRPQPNNTPENLRALRNDPIGDRNKQRDLEVAQADNQFVSGFGSSLGPTTRNSGMTPEQVARMQGPTAANQWRFPNLFRQPQVFSKPSNDVLDQQTAQAFGTTPGVNTEDVMLKGLREPTQAPTPEVNPQLTVPPPELGLRLPFELPKPPALAPAFSLNGFGQSFPAEPPTFSFNSGQPPTLPFDNLEATANRLRQSEAEQAKKTSKLDPIARGLRALFR